VLCRILHDVKETTTLPCTDRQTDRQAGRQADRQAGRQAGPSLLLTKLSSYAKHENYQDRLGTNVDTEDRLLKKALMKVGVSAHTWRGARKARHWNFIRAALAPCFWRRFIRIVRPGKYRHVHGVPRDYLPVSDD
jgi:hypothetical protein